MSSLLSQWSSRVPFHLYVVDFDTGFNAKTIAQSSAGIPFVFTQISALLLSRVHQKLAGGRGLLIFLSPVIAISIDFSMF